MSHNCLESKWRWIDCDTCETCKIRVCVNCGADIDAGEYEHVSAGGLHWVQIRKEATA